MRIATCEKPELLSLVQHPNPVPLPFTLVPDNTHSHDGVQCLFQVHSVDVGLVSEN